MDQPIDPQLANAQTVKGGPPPTYGGAQGAASRLEQEIKKGRYDINDAEELGEGGMGMVRAIKDRALRRKVAMKVLRGKQHTNYLESRLILEACITGILEHPGIVPVHDLGTLPVENSEHADVFFTMKKVDGHDLEKIIKLLRTPEARLEPEERGLASEIRDRFGSIPARLGLFLKVCDALAFAHGGVEGLQIIHRDLKPANIMVGAYGEVLVMDWGLAKPLGSSDLAEELRQRRADLLAIEGSNHVKDLGATQDGAFVGTWHFAPPEQIEGRLDDIEPRTDVYALGGLLYSLLTLDLPLSISEKTPPTEVKSLVLGLIEKGKTVPLARAAALPANKPAIPDALRPVILAALEPKPTNRPESVAILRKAVEDYLAGFANDFEKASPWKQICYYYQRNKPFCKTAAAAILVLSLLSIGFVWRLEKEKTTAQNAEFVALNAEKVASDAAIKEKEARQQAEKDKLAAESARQGEEEARILATKKAADAEEAAWSMIELAVPYIRKYGRGQQILDQIDLRFGGKGENNAELTQLDHAQKGIANLMRAEHEMRYGRQENISNWLKPALEHLWKWYQGQNHRELAVEPLRYAFGILANLPALKHFKDWGQADWTVRGEKFTAELQPNEARTAWERATKEAAKARAFSGQQLEAAEQMMTAIRELQPSEIDEVTEFTLWDMRAWHCAAHIRYSDEVAAKLNNQGKFNEDGKTVVESAIRRYKAIVKEIADFIRQEPMRRETAVTLLYVCSPVADALRDNDLYDQAHEIIVETQGLMARVADADPNNLHMKERLGEAINMQVTCLERQLIYAGLTPDKNAKLLQKLAEVTLDQIKVYDNIHKADDSRYTSELLLAKARSYRVRAIASLIEMGKVNILMPLTDAERDIQQMLDLIWQSLSVSPIVDSERTSHMALAAQEFVQASFISAFALSKHDRYRHLERAEQACAWTQTNNEPWCLAEIAEKWLQHKDDEAGSYILMNSPSELPGFLTKWRNEQEEWSKTLAREREIAVRCIERSLTVRLKLMSFTDFENLEPHFLQVARELEVFANMHFIGNLDTKGPSKQIFVRSYLDSSNLLNKIVQQDNIVYRKNERWIKSLADFASRMPMLWLRNTTVIPELRGAASGVANIGVSLRKMLRTAAPNDPQRAIEAANALQVSWSIDLLNEVKALTFDGINEPMFVYPSASAWNKLKKRTDEILHELNSASSLDSEKLLEREIAEIRKDILVDVIRIEAEAGDKYVAEEIYQSALKELKKWPDLVQQIKSLPPLFKKK